MTEKKLRLFKLGVLISGRGSNLMALHQHIQSATLNAEIAVVISNVIDAPGLAWAQTQGLTCYGIERKIFPSKAEYEKKITDLLTSHHVDLVVLAGYMAILGKDFIEHFRNRIVNIHPSLLPAFPGLHPQRQALAAGVTESGCTVHFVDEGVDTGKIIAQKTVPVLPDDTEDTLSERILKEEHQLYAKAIEIVANRL